MTSDGGESVIIPIAALNGSRHALKPFAASNGPLPKNNCQQFVFDLQF